MHTDRTGRVRLATPADVPDQARLRWEWRLAEGEQPTISQEAFTDEFGRWLASHAETHRGFVAEVGDEVVGIAFLATIERVPGPEVWDRRSGHLQSLYVDPPTEAAAWGGLSPTP